MNPGASLYGECLRALGTAAAQLQVNDPPNPELSPEEQFAHDVDRQHRVIHGVLDEFSKSHKGAALFKTTGRFNV